MKRKKGTRSGLLRRMMLVVIIFGVWVMSCGLFSSCEKGSNGRYTVAGKDSTLSTESANSVSSPPSGGGGSVNAPPSQTPDKDPQLIAEDQHIGFTGSPVTPSYSAAEGAEVKLECATDLTSPGEHSVRLYVAQAGGFTAAERTVTVTIDPQVTFRMYEQTVTGYVAYGGTAVPPSPVSVPDGYYFAFWEPSAFGNITENRSFDARYWRTETETPGSPCTHVHNDSCGYLAPGVACECDNVNGVHDANCPFITGLPCNHVHDAACGYVAASS